MPTKDCVQQQENALSSREQKNGKCVLTKGVKVWTRTEYAFFFYYDMYIYLSPYT